MNDFLRPALAALLLSGCSGIAFAHEAPQTPLDVARILEARIAAGEGITLPDAQPDVVHDTGAGGGVSINGRHYTGIFNNCYFSGCVGGTTHLRDGKGGAIAVGGGVQRAYDPENNIVVTNCTISNCSATGNGGALYVTIRGLLTVVDSTIQNCQALNSGTTPGNDWRKVAGMGGAIHVSAGGICILSDAVSQVVMSNNTANVSGGALSVKSGRAYLNGTNGMSFTNVLMPHLKLY